jgi:hypothetical protein
VTPTRFTVNPAIFAALDKLGPMPLPFFVPDERGEWVQYTEVQQEHAMSRDMRAKGEKLRPRSEWREEDGTALWWEGDEWATHCVPHVGDLRDTDNVPDNYQWWTPMPDFAAAAAATAGGEGETMPEIHDSLCKCEGCEAYREHQA